MKTWLKRFGGALDWPNNVSGRGKISDPFGDWDRDGIPNMNDCQPRNSRKQDKGIAPAMQNPGQQFINQERNLTSGAPTILPALTRMDSTMPDKLNATSGNMGGGSFIQQEKNLTNPQPDRSFPSLTDNTRLGSQLPPFAPIQSMQNEKPKLSPLPGNPWPEPGPNPPKKSITPMPVGKTPSEPKPKLSPLPRNPMPEPGPNPPKKIFNPMPGVKRPSLTFNNGQYIGDKGYWLFKPGRSPIFTTIKDDDYYRSQGYEIVVGTQNINPRA
jgi:hypothetical protein